MAMVTARPPMTAVEIRGHAAVLKESSHRESLAVSAIALASSGQPEAFARLALFLQNDAFLARLDALEEPQRKFSNLSQVLKALKKHPTQATGKLCEALVASPAFMAEPDRMIFLLPALAAVRPMSETALAIFRRFNGEGYFNSNGPLLVSNGDPKALKLFAEMVADADHYEPDRIDMIHWALLPHRLQPGVVEMARGLFDRGLTPAVEKALVETLFDDQSEEWFGPARNAPVAPRWSSGETSVLEAYLKLGRYLQETRKTPPELEAAVEKALQEIRAVLEVRRKLEEESKKPKR